LSVVIPVYNEAATIDRLLEAVQRVDLDKEIIVVDDHSSDGTRIRLQELAAADGTLRVIFHDQNLGKGAALRTGFAAARGRFVVIQDADLEYDPQEYPKLLQPLLDGQADVVYGSRFLDAQGHRLRFSWHTLGNRLLTGVSNMFTRLNLSDMETCFKVFPRQIIQSITVEENRFGVEPEITAKIAAYRQNGATLRIHEVAVSYRGRTYSEGKKVGWTDGVRAMWCIVKYNLLR
jgi:glycosyltransferase involved in cell wall biosynthesis